MSSAFRDTISFVELFDLPVAVDVRTAARAVGICPSTAYRLIRLGAFPCPVMRIGSRYRIATAELMRALGVEELPVYTVSTDAALSSDPSIEAR